MTAVRKGYPKNIIGNIVGADLQSCRLVISAAADARPLEIQDKFNSLPASSD